MKMDVLFYHNNILALFFLFKYISNGCSGVLKIHCLFSEIFSIERNYDNAVIEEWILHIE